MREAAIQNIIFDLGGVLLDIDLPYCIQRVKALGVDIDALSAIPVPELAKDIKPAVMGEGMVASGMLHLYQVGGISTSDFIKDIQHLCNPSTTYEQVFEAWNSCCIDIPQRRLDKVLELRKRGYHTCMLSNTNDAHWQDIKTRCFGGQKMVDKYFEHVFLSQEMQLAKPNEDIFLKVLEDLNVKAEECLFIDDSSANVKAASQLGFHTIHADISKTKNGKVIALPNFDWMNEIEKVLTQNATSQS